MNAILLLFGYFSIVIASHPNVEDILTNIHEKLGNDPLIIQLESCLGDSKEIQCAGEEQKRHGRENAIHEASERLENMQIRGHEVQQEVDGLFNQFEQGIQTPNDKNINVGRKKHTCNKKEVQQLKKKIASMKAHQAIEMEKLKTVKLGVEELVKSLHGTRGNLAEVKKESFEMEFELENLHKQAAAASKLEQEISEIQDHAKVNYETGEVELPVSGKISRLTLDEVAAKVQKQSKGNKDSANEALFLSSNLADPAVLHADLRLLVDIVILLCAAAIGGMLAAVVNMPPIVGYIAGGVIVGPSGLSLIITVVQVETLAQFGSIFFLFSHGAEYSVRDLWQFHSISIGGSLLSVALCGLLIQIYALWSGIAATPLEGGLLGLSASLSSLSIVLDFLHEEHLVQTVHGKLMVGMLAVQGMMMGLFFSIPPALSGGSISVGGVGLALGRAIVGILLVLVFTMAFARKTIPTILRFLLNHSDTEELFLLGIVSLALIMALLTEFLGLSLDLGAFFAGLILAGTQFMEKAATAVKPLSSTFAAMLFASIGMIINPMFFWNNMGTILFVVLNIFLVKFSVTVLVVRLFNYSWQTAVVSGFGLCHVGEFSLLFSSKLQAHMLLSRRAYLVYLSATVTTLVFAPLILRTLKLLFPRLIRALGHDRLGYTK